MMLFRSRRLRKTRLKKLARQLDLRLHIRVGRFLLYLAIFFTLHVIVILIFEDITVWQSIWLTATTITTVGYGDFSATTWQGQLATICLLYGPGITLLAQLAGDYIDLRAHRRDQMNKGYWRWEMQDHLAIINIPEQGGEEYLEQIVKQLRKTPQFEPLAVQLLTPSYENGLPEKLRDLNIFHYTGDALNNENLEAVATRHAKYIVILSEDLHNPHSDSVTLDILDRINHLSSSAYILAECINDNNRQRFYENGAHSVIRPMRAYPAFLVRALAAPGSERLLEDLFDATGEFVTRYNIEITNMKWLDIVYKLMQSGIGTALGYTDKNQQLTCNPQYNAVVTTTSLFVMVDESSHFTNEDILNAINSPISS